MKLMYAASTFSNVNEGVKRVDEIFAEAPVIEKRIPRSFPAIAFPLKMSRLPTQKATRY